MTGLHYHSMFHKWGNVLVAYFYLQTEFNCILVLEFLEVGNICRFILF